MRYHWGLAIGHAYTHGNLDVDPSGSTDGASHRDEDEHTDASGSVVIQEDEQEGGRATIPENDEGGSVVIPDDEEEGTDEESGDYLDERDRSDPGDDEERDDEDEDEDEEQVALVEMYGESQDIEFYQ